MTEVSKQIFKVTQCANIIYCLSEMYHITLEEATDIYYNSDTATLIEDEIADLHCRSEKYLATIVWEEYTQTKAIAS